MRLPTPAILTMLVVLVFSYRQQASFADEIPDNNIPRIEYHIDTGLVLLGSDGLALTTANIVFRDRETGGVGHNTNQFFDNSPDNPLFAEHGGLIPDWESYDVGESIWGDSTIAEGYAGSLRPWAQISSGLGSEDFLYAGYWWVGSYEGGQTNVTVIPEPGTVLLLGLGGVILLRRRKA